MFMNHPTLWRERHMPCSVTKSEIDIFLHFYHPRPYVYHVAMVIIITLIQLQFIVICSSTQSATNIIFIVPGLLSFQLSIKI